MRRVAGLVFFLCLASLGPCANSPAEILRNFEKAWNAHDVKQLSKLIKKGTINAELEKEEAWKNLPEIKISDIRTKIDHDKATTTFKLAIWMNGKERMMVEDMVEHSRMGKDWLIVPARPDMPLQAGIPTMARMASEPGFFERQKDAAGASAAISKVREIGLALIMFGGDNGGILKFDVTQEAARAAIKPYLRKEGDPWAVPGKSEKKFSVNLLLANRKVFEEIAPPTPESPTMQGEKITQWPKVVLAYEGEGGKLDFSRGGKAAVVFLDGHAKLITEEEAKTLVWKP